MKMWPWGVTREKYCHDLAALESKFSGINIDGICVPLEMRKQCRMMTTNGHGSSGDGGSTEKPGKTGDKQKERSGRGDDRDFRARS